MHEIERTNVSISASHCVFSGAERSSPQIRPLSWPCTTGCRPWPCHAHSGTRSAFDYYKGHLEGLGHSRYDVRLAVALVLANSLGDKKSFRRVCVDVRYDKVRLTSSCCDFSGEETFQACCSTEK